MHDHHLQMAPSFFFCEAEFFFVRSQSHFDRNRLCKKYLYMISRSNITVAVNTLYITLDILCCVAVLYKLCNKPGLHEKLAEMLGNLEKLDAASVNTTEAPLMIHI